MLNVVVVGAGPHFTSQHGPALGHFMERHPGRIRLAGICDLNAERAQSARKEFGFEMAFTSVEEMIERTKPGAALAILPFKGTLATLEQFMRRATPLVIEKPLGENMAEARTIAEAAKRWSAPVMVSLNRRFDPGILAAKEWLKDKGPIRYVAGSMLRPKRTEAGFIWGTGVHLLDAMVGVAGPLRLRSREDVRRAGDYGCVATLGGEGGLAATVEILPVCGREEERLRIVCEEACVDVWTGSSQIWSVRGYQGGQPAFEKDGTPGEPLDIQNGTYYETEAFLLAVLEGRGFPAPSISDAMIATGLADEMMRAK